MLKRLVILHADERLVVVDKPSGLVVHRSERAGDRDNCVARLRWQLGRQVHPLHRLDRGCSGALAFALDAEAARSLAAAFAERRVDKRYLAVVRGIPPEAGTIDRPIRDERGREAQAVTHFTRLASVELPYPVARYPAARYALVQAEPLTGREHQLRRHLRSINHPLIGDTTWGDGEHNRLFRERFASHRLLLHALSLRLPKPEGSGELAVTASPGADLLGLFAALGWPESTWSASGAPPEVPTPAPAG